MLLEVESIAKSYGPKDVLKGADIHLRRGESIGLVGANGTGKSTLLKMVIGEETPDSGEVRLESRKIGYLPQHSDFGGRSVVSKVVGTPFGRISKIKDEITHLEGLMASPEKMEGRDWSEVAGEYSRLQEEYGESGAHALSSKGVEALSKVGLSPEVASRTMGELSGGEKTKVMLARVLVQAEDTDLLLMDEPTSHLDIGTVEWLENYLSRYKGGIIVVSHDRYFLDNIAKRIVEIEDGRTTTYSGNYTEFVEKKEEERKRRMLAREKYESEKERQERIAREMYSKNSFGSTHKTRQKMIERMDAPEEVFEKNEMALSIDSAHKSGRNVIMGKGIRCSRGGRTVLNGADIDLESDDKMGIIGPNGSGKSTLLKVITGELGCQGELWVAPGAKIGYYDQEHCDLDVERGVEEQLLEVLGPDQKQKVRALLARFLLRGEAVERPVSTLSGGERARATFAMMIARKNNLLIMDEPTNYLDIDSKHAVERALSDYPGTLLIVTHDRYFLDSVCNKTGVLKDGELDTYAGNYSQMKKGKPVAKPGKVEDATSYRVVSGFKDWATKRKYSPGDRVLVADSESKRFEWAIKTGKMRKIRDGEKKNVVQGQG